MGIENFHKWVRDNYPESFNKSFLDHYDNVYIDLNYALHNCSYGAKTIDDIYAKLFKFILEVCAQTNPTHTLTLATDGSAPLSKLLLQRKRRLGKVAEEDDTLSLSLMFTPGTNFMTTLEDKLQNIAKYIEVIYNIQVKMELKENDEAELKLKRQVQRSVLEYPDESCIIVTNDSDLVVMLMSIKNLYKIYIYEKNFQSSEIISIGKILEQHIKKVGCSTNPHLDFLGINMFMGNDYLPKLPSITFEKLWDAYSKVLRSHPEGYIQLNNDVLIPDTKFLGRILMILLKVAKTTKRIQNDINISNIFYPIYANYVDGYMWCLTTYYDGVCKRYNYIYQHDDSPNILGLMLNIQNNKNIFTNSTELYPSINAKLYGILILPYKSKSLIDPSFYDFMDKHPVLYRNEKCKICKELAVEPDIELKKKLLKQHRKTHYTLSNIDIFEIIDDYKKNYSV